MFGRHFDETEADFTSAPHTGGTIAFENEIHPLTAAEG